MRLTKLRNNLYELKMKGKTIYFSYETVIGFLKDQKLILTTMWYSNTTTKHLNVLKQLNSNWEMSEGFDIRLKHFMDRE